MVYAKWTQRLYAFLLRRVVGPYLSAPSLKKLHETIDFSVQEGKYTLNDVELNATYLTQLLSKRGDSRVSTATIRRARIRKLQINLTLKEEQSEEGANTSSVAWRAMQLGRTATATSSVAGVILVAYVEIEGIDIELGPERTFTPPSPEAPSTNETSTAVSMISSYVDAAMSSLRLSLQIKDLRIKLCSARRDLSPTQWVELHLASAKYHDVDDRGSVGQQQSSYRTALHKAIDFAGITFQTGEQTHAIIQHDDASGDTEAKDPTTRKSIIAKTEGSGQVSLRAIEYFSSASAMSSSEADSEAEECEIPRIQQDLEVTLNQRLNFSLDHTSLQSIMEVANSFLEEAGGLESVPSHSQQVVDASPLEKKTSEDADLVEEDMQTMTGIMRQYAEARQLAERNEVRGGVLIPSTAFMNGAANDDDSMTFDAFFDANDHSFSMYQSRLEQSIMMSNAAEDGDADFVHTKVKFHLQQCGIKIVFLHPKEDLSGQTEHKRTSHRTSDEYLLLTLEDINITSSLSQKVSDISVSVVHLGIEDSVREGLTDTTRRGAALARDIGHVLRFVESTGDDVDSYGGLVTEAPCISLQVLVKKSKSSPSTFTIDLVLEPLEMVLRKATLSNVLSLTTQLKSGGETPKMLDASSGLENHERNNLLRFSASCPSISFTVPLGCVTVEDAQGRRDLALFDRCGYTLPHASISRRLSIGVSLDALSVVYDSMTPLPVVDAVEKTPCASSVGTTLLCHRILCFAIAPQMDSSKNITCMQQADIFASSGHAPLSLAHRTNISTSQEFFGSSSSFPTVPPLSSFKARQEDEDSDGEDVFANEFTSLARSMNASGTHGSDPQDAMLHVAENCSTVVDIYLPELVGDLTKVEATSLLTMMVAQLASDEVSTTQGEETLQVQAITPNPRVVGISICIDQISFCAHQKLDDDGNSGRWYSYKMMIEGFKAHAALGSSQVKTLRILSHEVNFFEVCDLVFSKEIDLKKTPSFRDRCDAVRRRAFQKGDSVAYPLFYRSQLFAPLSPESPALLFDAVSSNDESSENESEWNVHFTMYSITHRYDVESEWLNRLRKLLRVRDDSDAERKIVSTATEHFSQESNTKLIKLFVSFADCNLDYTSPAKFDTPSRTIVRLSDLRFSSNLVSPPGPQQACKVSLGDLSILLSNTRYGHNFENARLARASTVMRQGELMSVKGMVPDEVQRDMNLITMVTLDSMDMLLAVPSCDREIRGENSNREPLATVGLTFGRLDLYGCKDSFACFIGTLAEWQLYVTALDEEAVQMLREGDAVADAAISESSDERFYDSRGVDNADSGEAQLQSDIPPPNQTQFLTPLHSIMESAEVESRQHVPMSDFALGGQDWATVDHEWSKTGNIPPNEEQSARWYPHEDSGDIDSDSTHGIYIRAVHDVLAPGAATEDQSRRKVQIIPNYIPLNPVYDPSSQREMNAAKYAGTAKTPPVSARILVRDLKLRCRFFDGYDWPKSKIKQQSKQIQGQDFIIEIDAKKIAAEKDEINEHVMQRMQENPELKDVDVKKAILLGGLLDNCTESEETTFRDTPLPEERGAMLEDLAEQRRLARRMNRFFQISLSGLKMRLDTFSESDDHLLASSLDVTIEDFFVAETISNVKPVKLMGEWLNEIEHPRDSNDGLIMMKMVTWRPKRRLTAEGEIANQKSQATLEMLPLRCMIDQRAIRFALAFFSTGQSEDDKTGHEWALGLKEIPPPLFQSFKVKPCKLKVNYTPKKVDVAALREGSYVELINISPLVDMVILLQPVNLQGHVGFGPIAKELLHLWIEDICATQMYKFLANAKPFQPIASVTGGAANLVVLPWEAYKKGDNVRRAMRSGATAFAGTLAYETLNTTAQMTGVAARVLSSSASPTRRSVDSGMSPSPLPSRPNETPRGVSETANHAFETLARGFETANHKVVIVPYREYRKSGTAGAALSVMKGIPVAIAAPVGAATEALSYTLLGARNQVRPDIRKEEEASERGLGHDL